MPKLVNGTILPAKCWQAKSRYGEECDSTCEPGFELRGPSKRRCSDNGVWTEEEVKTRCIDITPPTIQCPDNITATAEAGENFASVDWHPVAASDNSGLAPDVVSVPVITELPIRLRIGASRVTYVAHDRRGNKAECTFTVTVHDDQQPTVDQCESPPTFLMRDKVVAVEWDEPVFSDNSGTVIRLERSHEPGIFPLGDTRVTYTAYDESGNSNSCNITITVEEHACHLPVDPIHGQANCSQTPEAVYCSLTCYDGYAFALPPPRDYFCAYDGQWLPADNPMPFPDCSISTHSQQMVQDGVLHMQAESKVCDDPFFMNHMQGQFQRRLAARLNEICGDNMICQVDDLQAECRQVMAQDGQHDPWLTSNEIPRVRRSITTYQPTKSRMLELRFKVLGQFLHALHNMSLLT